MYGMNNREFELFFFQNMKFFHRFKWHNILQFLQNTKKTHYYYNFGSDLRLWCQLTKIINLRNVLLQWNISFNKTLHQNKNPESENL